MTLAALSYARQSVGRAADGSESISVAAQLRSIREASARDGYQIEAEYQDVDVRGNVAQRAGLDALLARVREGGIAVIWVHDVSRLARDVELFASFINELQRYGATLLSVREPTGERWISLLHAVLAERERDVLAGRVAGAIRERARLGQTTGMVPYGFDRVPVVLPDGRTVRTLRAVEPQASVIRLVFERFADGWSYADLRRWLQADPTVPPRPRGGPWSDAALWFVLRHEVYTGVVAVTGQKPAGKRLADVRVEDAHEAIVPRELWDRVQRRLAESRPRARDDKEHHWLEGHVFCAACKSPMYYVVRSGKPGRPYPDRSWDCKRHIMHANGMIGECCPATRHRAGYRWVERAVKRELERALSRGGRVSDEALARRVAPPDRRAERLDAEVRALERQRDQLIDGLQHGAPASVLGPRIAALTDQIAATRRERSRVGEPRSLDALRLSRAYAADAAKSLALATDQGLRALAEQIGLRVEIDTAARAVRLGYGEEWEILG